MSLTDAVVRNSKPKYKPYKIFDAAGLYIEIAPNGGKYWRFKFRFGGKEKRLSLGVYPEVGLKEVRERRDEYRKLLRNGIDPSATRKAEQAAQAEVGANSFEVIAREWFGKFSQTMAASHSSKIIRRLERDVFPWIGGDGIANITATRLLTVLRRIESRGAIETAHRAMQNCGRVFRYAVSTGRAERDPTADLRRDALQPAREKHHASITDPKGVGELMRAIDGYRGSQVTKCALQLAPLLFVRPGELRGARWEEINYDSGELRIPAERMKMRAPHIVPLSMQTVKILREELQPLTGGSKFLFPSVRSGKRSMSENTVNAALRRLGYSNDQMTGHGFRSMASTMLNEQGWNRDAIERQLAHAERDAIRAAYNYAEHLPERRKMMQAWADYLDDLRAGAKVISLSVASPI